MNENIEIIDLREKFFKVSNNIFELNLDIYEIGIYVALCRFANNERKESFPSLNTICKMLNISKPKLIQSIKSLIEKHLIYKKSGNSKVSNRYYLLSIPIKSDEVVNDINQCSKQHLPRSKPHLPPVVNDVNSINTNIINTKEKDLIINIPDKSGVVKIRTYYHTLLTEYDICYKPTAQEYMTFASGYKKYCADFSDDEIMALMKKWFSEKKGAWCGYSLKNFWADIGKLQVKQEEKLNYKQQVIKNIGEKYGW